MSPIAPDAVPALPGELVLPETLLEDGETVILAIKPSRWFVFLVSWPALWLSGLMAIVATLAVQSFSLELPGRVIMLAAVTVAVIRLLLACAQWLGRWYILTNYRLIQVRGVLRMEVCEAMLTSITKTFVMAGPIERRLGDIGSLIFDCARPEDRPPSWVHINTPQEIEELVDQTVRRARHMRNRGAGER